MKNILIVSLLLASSTLALAKLPVLSSEAKAKSDEAAAKIALSTKVDAYQLCQSQDKVAAGFYKTAQAAGKEAKPPEATPPCSDPGAFAHMGPQSPKPLEVSGAHSPADTALAPPSSKAVDAVLNPDKKP